VWSDKPKAATDNFRCTEGKTFFHLDYPLNPGGALYIGDKEESSRACVIVNLEAIKVGLALMADKYPEHWGNFMSENDDAETGDVFFQLVCFGEVIYG
jgi:hypothetical protein